MSSPQARETINAQRRLMSLERRFRDMAGDAVKYLHQLLDVSITYEGSGEVLDGDVLTYDDERKMWVARAGGTGGAFSSARVSGMWSADVFSDFVSDWSLYSDSAFQLAPNSPDGLDITGPGIYHASATAWTEAGESEITLRIMPEAVTGWQHEDEEGECRWRWRAVDQGMGYASASLDFPMNGADSLHVDIESSAEVTWVLTVHLVHPAGIIPGDCDG